MSDTTGGSEKVDEPIDKSDDPIDESEQDSLDRDPMEKQESVEPISDIVGSVTATVFGTEMGNRRELPDEGQTGEDGRLEP